MPSFIWGVDPGPEECAVVCWDKESEQVYLSLEGSPRQVAEAILEGPTGKVFVEWVTNYGMTPGASVFDTCRMVGQIEAYLAGRGEVHLISRPKIKHVICGTTRAQDKNIARALYDRFGERGTKKNPGKLYDMKNTHLRSALAAALAGDQLESEGDLG